MINNREEPRVRSIKGARAVVEVSGTGHDCVIKNISGRGARIVLDEPVDISKRFQLYIKTENKTMLVSKRWQLGRQVGVRFDENLAWIDRHLAA